MTNAIEKAGAQSATLAEQVAVIGDLSKLSSEQRMRYYGEVCQSLGLNPLSRPFEYVTLNGRLVLYAKKDAGDQLRKIHGISINIAGRERIEDVYIVTARATTPDGRSDESTGVVSIANLKGDALANALMKAETKAKRRVTLSIVGLGWMDESELDTVRDARPTRVDYATGEIVDTPKALAAPAGRDALVNDLRRAYKEAKRRGADVSPPTRDEIAAWDDATLRGAIEFMDAAGAADVANVSDNEG